LPLGAAANGYFVGAGVGVEVHAQQLNGAFVGDFVVGAFVGDFVVGVLVGCIVGFFVVGAFVGVFVGEFVGAVCSKMHAF
jgi:hypothetical protein